MSSLAEGPIDVAVDGRIVKLTNLDRVIWPEQALTKGWMINAYTRLAPALLPHLRGRPVTMWRFPAGVHEFGWWQNECRGAPDWVAGYSYTGPDGRAHFHCVIDDLSSLIWLINLGTVEIHPFSFSASQPLESSWMVFDLDPGEPAGLREACEVAMVLKQMLVERELRSFAKTSGGRGIHVYVPLKTGVEPTQTKAFARSIAMMLARALPEVVVDGQSRELRHGRVLVDWLQNDRSRSMIAPYSLRATQPPLLSTPIRWSEVQEAASGDVPDDSLRFGLEDVLERFRTEGDLFEPVLTLRQELPAI